MKTKYKNRQLYTNGDQYFLGGMTGSDAGGIAASMGAGALGGAAAGPAGIAIGAGVGLIKGLVGAKGSADARSAEEEAAERQRQIAVGQQRQQINSSIGGGNVNLVANGGNIGEAVTEEFTQFNEGGSHEANPLGGIPISQKQDGTQNLVEEGETKNGDYVFSNRLKIESPEEFLLSSKTKGKTFADASKEYHKQLEERPNDTIAKSTFKSMTGRLEGANDSAKMKESGNSFAEGGVMDSIPANLESTITEPMMGLQGLNYDKPFDVSQTIPEIKSKPRGYENMLLDFGKNPHLPQKTNKANLADKIQFFKDVRESNQSVKKGEYVKTIAENTGTDTHYANALNNKFGGKLYANGGRITEGEYDLGDVDLDMQEINFLKSQGYNVEPINVNKNVIPE